jgi:hypothetical protein
MVIGVAGVDMHRVQNLVEVAPKPEGDPVIILPPPTEGETVSAHHRVVRLVTPTTVQVNITRVISYRVISWLSLNNVYFATPNNQFQDISVHLHFMTRVPYIYAYSA